MAVVGRERSQAVTLDLIEVGDVCWTPFDPGGPVKILEIEGLHPVVSRRTVRVLYLTDHPHGYKCGTEGRYFLDEMRDPYDIRGLL